MLHTEMTSDKSGQVFNKLVKFVSEPPIGLKAYRADEVAKQTVVVRSLVFDADETAMDRISRIVNLANWKYNQAVAAGVSEASAYLLIYQTQLPWKTADNALVTITVQDLCEALDAAVNGLGTIWVKYG